MQAHNKEKVTTSMEKGNLTYVQGNLKKVAK